MSLDGWATKKNKKRGELVKPWAEKHGRGNTHVSQQGALGVQDVLMNGSDPVCSFRSGDQV